FFFPSRRRHTRSKRDWSSDVCSSDLTVSELAKVSGISSRTLRYYDQIGLLKPAEVNKSGYRIYKQKELDLLQQILFYREMDMRLEDIKKIIHDPNFDQLSALKH